MKFVIYERALRDIYPAFLPHLAERYGDALELVFVAQNEREAARVRAQVDLRYDIVVVSEYFEKHWDEFTVERLSASEKKYDCSPVWSIIYTDRFLIDQPYEYCVKIACGYFALYDEIFSKGGDFYLDETIALLSSYIGYTVAKGCGAKYRAMMLTRGFDASYHYFLGDPYQLNVNFDVNYMTKDYPAEVRALAEKTLAANRDHYVKPDYMNVAGKLPKFQFGYLFTPLQRARAKKEPRFNNKYDYISYQGWKTVGNPAKFYRQYKSYRNEYKQPIDGDKFVFFPLHFQPEATTLVCAPKYEKQLYYIDSWAKSLPADTKLYVKEHYAFLGHRDPSFYKELKKYPNVRLIDPLFPARELILRSEAVTTLTGTAGWEAFLLGKPVIMGGRMFYENAPGVVRVDDVYQKYDEIMANWKKPTDEQIIRYLCEHISTMYAGTQCQNSKILKDPENRNNLGVSFVAEIERCEKEN